MVTHATDIQADPMLSVEQLAVVLNVSPAHARDLCNGGIIPAVNVGMGARNKCWRVKLSVAEQFKARADNMDKPPAVPKVPKLPHGLTQFV